VGEEGGEVGEGHKKRGREERGEKCERVEKKKIWGRGKKGLKKGGKKEKEGREGKM